MVAKYVWQYIKDNCNPYATVEMDGLSDDNESISVQAGRSNPVVESYMNHDSWGEFVFEVRAKSDSRIKANTWMQSLVDHFIARPNIPLDNKIFFKAEPLVAPYLLERGNDGGFIYTASFNVEYDERYGE